MIDRAVVHDAERRLIGGLLLFGDEFISPVRAALAPGEFFAPKHQHIVDAVFRLDDRGHEVNPLTVAAELGGLLANAGGMEYLAELIALTPSTSPSPEITIIGDDAWRRAATVEIATVAAAVNEGAAGGRAALARLLSNTTITTTTTTTAATAFEMLTLGEMGVLVDAAPAANYVVRPILVEADYGVIGATKKAGKSWFVLDVAVNVAAGGNVLGVWPVDSSGTVLLFAGEGGRRKIVRRGRAVAGFYGLDFDALTVYVRERAPKLADLAQVEVLRATVAQYRPRLVIIDPAYLALTGADTKNLASMGELLERVQLICQEYGGALLVSHHWNKNGTGVSADRFTGAGFAEWGRVLISAEVRSSSSDAVTKSSTVLLRMEIVGDELADTGITFRRQVWADDPNDLTSAMHYEIAIIDEADLPTSDDLGLPGGVKLKPSAMRVLAVLRSVSPSWLDAKGIGDRLAMSGHPLRSNTIYEAARVLVAHNLAHTSGNGATIVTTWAAAT